MRVYLLDESMVAAHPKDYKPWNIVKKGEGVYAYPTLEHPFKCLGARGVNDERGNIVERPKEV